jgi:GNAT superfamily N-acetyltransferase
MSQENVESALPVRVATTSDLDDLTALLTTAFENDPLWSWAFPDSRDLAVWWRFCIGSALRYPCVWITGDFAAASVWIPPDGVELTEEEEQRVEPLLRDLVGPRAPDVLELVERFDASHPRETPHYYLSLLGTHLDYRGQGFGMALLGENLARMDAEGVPAYLESSNPANDRRYQRLGFKRLGEFTTPGGERTVGTMWREVEVAEAAVLRE